MLEKFASETYRVLRDGRIAVLNIDDMLVNGIKYPITADAIKIFKKLVFYTEIKLFGKNLTDI